MKKNFLSLLIVSVISIPCFAHSDFVPIDNTYESKEIKLSKNVSISFVNANTGENLDIYSKLGKKYLAGNPGDNYEIRICNNDYRYNRKLSVVSVDGLNVISGENAGYNQAGYVTSIGNCINIKGWRKNLNEEARFVFTSVSNSYAARTGKNINNTGVIGFAIFDEKVDEVFLNQRAAVQDASGATAELNASTSLPATTKMMKEEKIATGHGERIESNASKTEFKRASQNPSMTLSVYYDSYDNLLKKGIVGKKDKEPNPFPNNGFAPDPK